MRAPAVCPRAISPITGDPLPLVDLVRDAFGNEAWKRIALVGKAGSGRSTALAALADVVPPDRMRDDVEAPPDRGDDVLVYAAEPPWTDEGATVFELAPWGMDEVIEYLLARHPERCASVVARIDDPAFARGLPAIWVPILDAMARDEQVRDVRTALRGKLDDLLRYPPARLLSDGLAWIEDLRTTPERAYALRPWHWLIDAVTPVLTEHDEGILWEGLRNPSASLPASILNARGRSLELPPRVNLANARLPGADLTKTRLAHAVLFGADLRGADLTGADLLETDARRAVLDRADLIDAGLCRTRGKEISLVEARLDNAYASRADLRFGDLRGASLRNTVLYGCDLHKANLSGAHFCDADLQEANLEGARVKGADFRRAVLTGACLRGVVLSVARWDGACLDQVDAGGAHLTNLHLPNVDLRASILTKADFTGSRMPGANFLGCDLREARAGHVDWEGADLRATDLRQVSFHMGSSRSGLVQSVIASEGSRTGFYTDERQETHFKAPEEIRLANLRGADLRGAEVSRTDFYLVDLRGAKCSGEQFEWFKKCGALL